MGRAPCCDKEGLKKGPWTPEEDKLLVDYIQEHGHGSWRSLPKLAGLLRCGKSCRLRWTNYLRPDIKRGPFTPDEQKSIIQLHGIVGNKWSTIASQLPGRTDNEVKNYWNTHLKKRIIKMGLDPDTYAPAAASSPSSPASTSSPSVAAASSSSAATPSSSAARHMAQWESARLEAEARLSKDSLLRFPAESAAKSQAESDVFLRIWNSEVGEAFRSNKDPPPPVMLSVSSPASSSLSTKCDKKECCLLGSGDSPGSRAAAAAEEEVDAEPKSSSLDEVVDDASEESYQLYLDFAASDDMSLCISGLFHTQFGGGFSLFGGGDLNVETFDSAFKWDGEKTRV